jgi:heptosyltransferase-1
MSARRRLLVIKTSSLGDVVHALPAVSDVAALPESWSIDWVCEEAFADIPGMHRAVDRVIPCAMRRWRSSLGSPATRAEIAALRATLRASSYDAVLDLQGLVKSAVIAAFARGPRHGYAWKSAREPLATLAYTHRHAVPWGQHAIDRNRQLTAAAIGTNPGSPVEYGVRIDRAAIGHGDPYVVALHATSRDDKLWPEAQWRLLLQRLSDDGVRAVLPWGNDAEHARALRLALDIGGASVPERMPPRELARLFAGATAVVGVDTGLAHLAAAVGTPVLCLFTATDPLLTGVVGERAPALNLGGNGSVPTVDEAAAALRPWLSAPVAGAARE